jgi:hypothetical protein
MATLIRLKQIESGSFLNTAATIGQDFSQSVVDIIVGEVAAALPDGVISSSVQVDLLQTTNFVGFSSSISNSIAETNNDIITLSSSVSASFGNVYIQLANITGSIESGLSASVATSISASNSRITKLELFSSSLDNGFATDAELTLTSSLIVDQGEW